MTDTTITILKKSTPPKLSYRAEGDLTYHIGHKSSSKTFYFRITDNVGGGFFSNEWIALNDIAETAKTNSPNKPFKALIFRNLFQSKGANNHGFLAAILRTESVMLPVDKQSMSHTMSDLKLFKASMQPLIKDKTNLHDDVAEAAQLKETKRAEMIAKMKGNAKATKTKSKTK